VAGQKKVDEVTNLKNCKLCRFSRACNDLPGICILLQYAAVATLVAALGYLFISQELLLQ
jgi:hypothetical protein